MNKKVSAWENLTPEDLIEKMFERTDADGVLYMPSFFTGRDSEEAESLRCVMRWELPNDCFAVLQEFDRLQVTLGRLAEHCEYFGGDLKEGVFETLTEQQKDVWRIYLSPFESDDSFDGDRLENIDERISSKKSTREICEDIIAGKEIDELSMSILHDGINVKVSEEEEAFANSFCEARKAECRQRLGDSPFAYYTVMYAKRFHKLLTLEAPDIIVNNEAKALASALTLFRRCKKYEHVDNAVRLHYDRRTIMSEEELDALSRPKNANSRKSLVPLFVYLILLQHSDAEHPLKQQEIISYLADEPYEVVIERKALSRVLHNLRDSQLGIYTDNHRGAWHMGGLPEEV